MFHLFRPRTNVSVDEAEETLKRRTKFHDRGVLLLYGPLPGAVLCAELYALGLTGQTTGQKIMLIAADSILAIGLVSFSIGLVMVIVAKARLQWTEHRLGPSRFSASVPLMPGDQLGRWTVMTVDSHRLEIAYDIAQPPFGSLIRHGIESLGVLMTSVYIASGPSLFSASIVVPTIGSAVFVWAYCHILSQRLVLCPEGEPVIERTLGKLLGFIPLPTKEVAVTASTVACPTPTGLRIGRQLHLKGFAEGAYGRWQVNRLVREIQVRIDVAAATGVRLGVAHGNRA